MFDFDVVTGPTQPPQPTASEPPPVTAPAQPTAPTSGPQPA